MSTEATDSTTENEDREDAVNLVFTRSCEHYTARIEMTAEMGTGSMEKDAIERMALAAKVLVYGAGGVVDEVLRESSSLMGSVRLEDPTSESVREAVDTLIADMQAQIGLDEEAPGE